MVDDYLETFGYAAILLLTLLEGETIVIIAGAAAFQGHLDLPLVALFAFTGTFIGDQMYYYIGRRYGTRLLERFPSLERRIAWAMRLVRKYETPFILSFRFIYGVRNVSPFAIGMAGVPRLKFLILNLIAAIIWAIAFSCGGYLFGHLLEEFVAEHQVKVLVGLLAVVLAVGLWHRIRAYRRNRRRPRPGPAADGSGTTAALLSPPHHDGSAPKVATAGEQDRNTSAA